MNRPSLASAGSAFQTSALLKRWGFLVLFLALSCQPKPPISELYVIAQVPDWQLKNQSGAEFGSNDLRGKVYLANFVFSRCPSVCPKMLQGTSKIQDRLKGVGGVALVSFTVDPDYDTPEVLSKLATQYGAIPAVWSFLTHGDKESLLKLYRDGFKINVSPAQPVKDLYDIAHSEKMVLVDQIGQIRGYYGYEEATIDQLIIDATYLAKNPGVTP